MNTLITILLLFSAFSLPAETPFFQARTTQPYHLSVGAVLFDQNGRVACHHFKNFLGYEDVYILMRESMENDESPLMTLHRGLKEEFAATAEPVAFLGSLSGYLPSTKLAFDKTTLYIACQLVDWKPEERDLTDPEGSSMIEWHDPNELIAIMQRQGAHSGRVDADESEIIRRAIPYICDCCNKD